MGEGYGPRSGGRVRSPPQIYRPLFELSSNYKMLRLILILVYLACAAAFVYELIHLPGLN